MNFEKIYFFFVIFSFLLINNPMEMSLDSKQLKEITNAELRLALYNTTQNVYIQYITYIIGEWNKIENDQLKKRYYQKNIIPSFLNFFYNGIGIFKNFRNKLNLMCYCQKNLNQNELCKNNDQCKEISFFMNKVNFLSFKDYFLKNEYNNQDDNNKNDIQIIKEIYQEFKYITQEYLSFLKKRDFYEYYDTRLIDKIFKQISNYNEKQTESGYKVYYNNIIHGIYNDYLTTIVNLNINEEKSFNKTLKPFVHTVLHEILHFLSWYNSSLLRKDELLLFSFPCKDFRGIVVHDLLKFNYFMEEDNSYNNIIADIIALLNAPLTECLLFSKEGDLFEKIIIKNNPIDLQLFQQAFFKVENSKDVRLDDTDFCRAFELMWLVLKKSLYVEKLNNHIDIIFNNNMENENIKKFIYDSVCFVKIFQGLKDILLPRLVQISKDHKNFIRLLTLECIKNGSIYSAQDFKNFLKSNQYAQQENQQYEKKIQSLENTLYQFFGIKNNELNIVNISPLGPIELKSVACFYNNCYPEEIENIIVKSSYSGKVLNNTPENQEYQDKLKSTYILFKDMIFKNNVPEGFLLKEDDTFKKDLLLLFISNIFKPDTEISFKNISNIKDQ